MTQLQILIVVLAAAYLDLREEQFLQRPLTSGSERTIILKTLNTSTWLEYEVEDRYQVVIDAKMQGLCTV